MQSALIHQFVTLIVALECCFCQPPRKDSSGKNVNQLLHFHENHFHGPSNSNEMKNVASSKLSLLDDIGECTNRLESLSIVDVPSTSNSEQNGFVLVETDEKTKKENFEIIASQPESEFEKIFESSSDLADLTSSEVAVLSDKCQTSKELAESKFHLLIDSSEVQPNEPPKKKNPLKKKKKFTQKQRNKKYLN